MHTNVEFGAKVVSRGAVRSVLTLLAAAMGLAAVGASMGVPVASAEPSPLRIGVLLPLSGPSAAAGQDMLRGYVLAQEQINQAGGVLGRPLELVIEDDKNDPPTAVAAFERLVNREGIRIFVGGVSSTVTYALANPARRYRPLMVWTGAAASAVEEAFADADWFFHLHPWEYHNVSSAADFLKFTGARRVAILYEEGLFGTSSARLAHEIFKPAGIDVVLSEPFKSGSGEFNSLLVRARAVAPDVLLWIGYDADAVPVATQARELGLNTKLIYGYTPGWPPGFGSVPEGEYMAALQVWAPTIRTESSRQFLQAFETRWGRLPVTYWAPMAYTNLMVVVDAIRRAGSTDMEPLKLALAATEYASPMGPTLRFGPSRRIRYQGFTTLITGQWQKGHLEVVFPSQLATAPLVYPVPAWRER